MAIPLALPLAPLAPGAVAAAGTFIVGSAAYIAQQVYGFRAPARAPSIPRTGGKAGGATLKEMIADVVAGARIPVALPPNPMGPQGSLGLAGVLAAAGFLGPRLAQLWGWLSSRPKKTVAPGGLAAFNLSGEVGAEGGKVFITITAKQRFHSCYVSASTQCYGAVIDANTATNFRKDYGPGGGGLTVTTEPGDACGINSVNVRADSGGLSFIPSATCTAGSGSYCGDLTEWSVDIEYRDPIGARTAPSFPLTPQVAYPSGFRKPAVVPAPARLPALPLPSSPMEPAPVPVPVPEVTPGVVPTTPGPSAPPATVPEVPRRTVPLPLPGATPTVDGLVVPQAPAPVAVTPPDAHFPVPGAPPVTGNGPRPTPQGIAQELGRLEQKLARLSDPGPGGNGDGTDRLGLLFQTLNRLVDFLTSITAGGGYELSSPCVLDDLDERIVTTVEYGGGLSSLNVLSNKIDALAALLQVHKDLKQPICKQTPAVGQPVTVDFLQVD